MKILLVAVITSMTLLPVLQSCQSASKASGPKMLKFNFEKGKVYDYETIINIDQNAGGTSRNVDMSVYYSMDVIGEEDSSKTIVTTYQRYKMSTQLGGMNFELDTDNIPSDTAEKRNTSNPLSRIIRVLGMIKGRQFTMKVDAEGQVLEVSGFKEMVSAFTDSLQLGREGKQEMMQMFSQQFNEKSIKQQFQRMLYIFPNKEVKVGDSWTKTTETSGILGARYNSTYTVKDIDGVMVTLEEVTKLESAGDQMQIKGDLKGTLIIDSKTGLIVNSDQEMNGKAITGGVSVDIAGKYKVKGKAR